MSRLQTSFVLGYHGCEKSFGMKAVNGESSFVPSKGVIDWLGTGIYFWEGDPRRAMEWATQKKIRGDIKEPFVVGAVIDLGNCLDLCVRENIELVKLAYKSFSTVQRTAGLPMPENKIAPKDKSADKVLRFLDCAVINHLHSIVNKGLTSGISPFDTVRALFPEGLDLYDGSGFKDKSHSQIAVLNTSCIKGVFLPVN